MQAFANLQRGQVWLAGWLLGSLVLLGGCGPAGPLGGSGAETGPVGTFDLPTPAQTDAPTPQNTRVLPLDSLTPEPTPTITPIPDEVRGFVVQVIDGETIAVVLEGDPPGLAYEVRYIGIDAPPNAAGEPWGLVAYETNRKLTGLQIVRLVRDQTETDEDGRLLRHVYADNKLLSVVLAEQGLARAEPSGDNDAFDDEISAAEARAQAGQLGVWAGSPPTATPVRAATAAEGEATEEPTTEPETTASPETPAGIGTPVDETTTPGPTAETTATPGIATSTPTGSPTAEEEVTPTPTPEEGG